MNDLVYAVLIAGFLSASSQVQTAVLDNAEVATLLAVLASVGAKQRHLLAAACQRSEAQKRGKVFTWAVSAEPPLIAKTILLPDRRKCPLGAKVRLGDTVDYFSLYQ